MVGYCILSLVVLLLLIITIRTIMFKNDESNEASSFESFECDEMVAAKKLSEAVQVKTISNSDYSKTDWEAFSRYHKVIEGLFPLVHTKMSKEVINGYSLLYHWKGKKSNKKPIIITAHMDVVPIEEGTEKDWVYPPFSGDIKDGFVWGRGAIDTKIHMITALEAAEKLLEDHFIPERDIYFAFGHDEEVGGSQGASEIVRYLKEKGIAFDFLIDEGGSVTEGAVGEITKPLALIGIGEKGYANIKISAEGDGGHASMPPKHTALGRIGKVINNLEKKQCKMVLTNPIREFLLKIGPEMKLANRIILSNLWLFKPLFMKVFSGSKSGNAMLRTTTAVTMAEGSMEPNVLPQKASVTCNFRIRPGETGEDLVDHIKEINKGIPIQIDTLRLEDPSLISSSRTDGFNKMESVIKHLYDDVIVAPYIVLAGTDARKYEPVCENIYRFTPFLLDQGELDRIHSTNERISIDNIRRCVEFFYIMFKEV